MTSKDYDLYVLCMSFIFQLYNERNVLVNNGPNMDELGFYVPFNSISVISGRVNMKGSVQ